MADSGLYSVEDALQRRDLLEFELPFGDLHCLVPMLGEVQLVVGVPGTGGVEDPLDQRGGVSYLFCKQRRTNNAQGFSPSILSTKSAMNG
jgi:hypothetical protein